MSTKDDPRALLREAASHARGGRLPEAIAAYQEAIALDPSFAHYRFSVAELCFELQRYAAQRLKQRQIDIGSDHQSGAVVVLDVITGDVIAMVSQPGFDPNMFARGITQTEWRDLLDNPLITPYLEALVPILLERTLEDVVKAKLEAVEAGISTLEREFLADIVLPSGQTFGAWAAPQLESAYANGRMPALLPETTR